MISFATPGLETKSPDPGKHVNYTLGMVLGVDDFNQEFAYLAGRDQWLARDAIGYGTLVGLRVTPEATAKGPRVNVTSGTALMPTGRLVCVKPAQCGYLNDWLSANKNLIPSLIGSPLSPTLALYLTLCHRECPVDPVPIPGEPCRSESELMAPSRLVDDFLLELRAQPPDQREEDLLREFIAWMRMLAFGGGGPYATVEDLVAALRASVTDAPSSPLGSPLGSPLATPAPHFTFGSPLAGLDLDPALASEYFRAAFRVWATEIRPKVHPPCGGCASDCGTPEPLAPPPPDACLLLARIEVPIINIGGDEWRVDETRTVAIDESRRPVVLSLRVLQEWSAPPPSTGGAPAAVTTGPSIVAAGLIGIGGADGPTFGAPAVTAAGPAGMILVSFGTYTPPDGTFQLVVKAMAATGGVPNPVVAFDSFTAAGIQLRVSNGAAPVAAATLNAMRFMVEVTRVQA
jgi:hypothetical protein